MSRVAATEEQRLEVLRRRAAGETYRAIAAAVFGSSRLKDRVARIVRDAIAGAGDDEPSGDQAGERLRAELEHLLRPSTRADRRESLAARAGELLVAYRGHLLERLRIPGAHVTASEISAIVALELKVENLAQLERLRELTRER